MYLNHSNKVEIFKKHISISVHIFLKGNLKEEIKQLQDTEQQVKNRVTELTEKKETFTVREFTLLYSSTALLNRSVIVYISCSGLKDNNYSYCDLTWYAED